MADGLIIGAAQTETEQLLREAGYTEAVEASLLQAGSLWKLLAEQKTLEQYIERVPILELIPMESQELAEFMTEEQAALRRSGFSSEQLSAIGFGTEDAKVVLGRIQEIIDLLKKEGKEELVKLIEEAGELLQKIPVEKIIECWPAAGEIAAGIVTIGEDIAKIKKQPVTAGASLLVGAGAVKDGVENLIKCMQQ